MKFKNKGRMIDTDSINTRMELVMIEKDLNDYELAEKWGEDRTYVTRLRTGKRPFDLKKAASFCKALDVDFIWFITGVKV